MTAGQLAAEARLTSGSITAAIDRMERAGYVRRVADPEDRRRVLVEPTARPRGRDGADGPPGWATWRFTSSAISDEQLQVIVDFSGSAGRDAGEARRVAPRAARRAGAGAGAGRPQSPRTSAPCDSNGARITRAQSPASRWSASITAPVWS